MYFILGLLAQSYRAWAKANAPQDDNEEDIFEDEDLPQNTSKSKRRIANRNSNARKPKKQKKKQFVDSDSDEDEGVDEDQVRATVDLSEEIGGDGLEVGEEEEGGERTNEEEELGTSSVIDRSESDESSGSEATPPVKKRKRAGGPPRSRSVSVSSDTSRHINKKARQTPRGSGRSKSKTVKTSKKRRHRTQGEPEQRKKLKPLQTGKFTYKSINFASSICAIILFFRI